MNTLSVYLSYLPKRFAALLVSLLLLLVPFVAVNAQESNGPEFNKFPDAAVTGDERDFLRVDEAGGDAFTNEVEACEGEVDLWVYVHNGQDEKHNGDDYTGPGVALDTRVAIDLPTGESNSHEPEARITASNAATVADTAFINCDDHEVELEYVTGTARGYSVQRGNFTISDQIMSNNGTLIGPMADDGKVPGCWDYRVWIKVTVKVKKVEKPEPIFECTGLTAIPAAVKPDQDVTFKATANAENAEVTSYVFNFGDGENQTVNSSNESVETKHSYDEVGTYTARVTVNFDVDNEQRSNTNDKCVTKVTVEEEPEEPPVTPPTEQLPVTGPAQAAAGFFGTSALFMGARSWLESRRLIRAGLLKK